MLAGPAKRLAIKPLPCPFCGRRYKGSAITERGRARRFECPRCGALGPFAERNQKENQPQSYYDRLTIEAWNKRSTHV